MARNPVDDLASIPRIPANELMHRIAKELSELPPAAYQLAIKTNDQIAIWREAKHFYKCVACVIDAYVDGGKKPDYGLMAKEKWQAIDNQAWSHLSLYSLIFFNWEAIARHLKNVSAPIMPAISGDALPLEAKNFFTLDSPVEVFVEAAKHRAVGHMYYAFAQQRTEFIPYRLRKQIENNKMLRKANTPKSLVTQLRADRLKRYDEQQWTILEDTCLILAEKSKPGKDSAAGQAIASYKKSISAEEEMWSKRMHKRKKPAQIIWENGYQIID